MHNDKKACIFRLLACHGALAFSVDIIVGGEFEAVLAGAANGKGSLTPLERLQFITPDRSGLPPLEKYSHMHVGGIAKTVGYTEGTRGCKHLCRHCPIVPVYNGVFRVVQSDVVLADIRQQVAAGARHITFGDPDFFNGPTHAMRIVEALHREFPDVTYDVTIKIEHLLQHSRLLESLKRTGCVLVTSAVESIDDAVLEKLDKRHTRADFVAAVRRLREVELDLAPTFIAFTPWTTRASYGELLRVIAAMELIENVSLIQLALRLLIPAGSRMLELDHIRAVVDGYDEQALLWRWRHPDPAIDELAARALRIAGKKAGRAEAFRMLWEMVWDQPPPVDEHPIARAA